MPADSLIVSKAGLKRECGTPSFPMRNWRQEGGENQRRTNQQSAVCTHLRSTDCRTFSKFQLTSNRVSPREREPMHHRYWIRAYQMSDGTRSPTTAMVAPVRETGSQIIDLPLCIAPFGTSASSCTTQHNIAVPLRNSVIKGHGQIRTTVEYRQSRGRKGRGGRGAGSGRAAVRWRHSRLPSPSAESLGRSRCRGECTSNWGQHGNDTCDGEGFS